MGRQAWLVGVDVGGTNIKIGAVTGHTVLGTVGLATREHATPERFLDGMEDAVARLARQHGLARRRLGGVGVGVPGLVDGRRGIIHRLVNVPGGWRGVPLRRLLERRLRARAAVDNDVNVIALGEWRCGAGRGTRESVYVTLGTGVGGGLVINGQLVRGVAGSAGEIGHMVLQPDGPRCACGNRGCLEALVGTAAILRRGRQAMRRGSRTLARVAARTPGGLSPAVVSRAARAGDRAAKRIWDELGEDLGRGLAGVVNLLNPERLVIGGGVAGAWRWFAPSLRRTIHELAFDVSAKACHVVRAQLGDRAGILGGAMLVSEKS